MAAVKLHANRVLSGDARGGVDWIADCIASAADVPALVAEVEHLTDVDALTAALIDAECLHEWVRWDNLGAYRQEGVCRCGEFRHTVDAHQTGQPSGLEVMARHRAEAILASRKSSDASSTKGENNG
jgi:hypothetical protein